MEQGGDMRLEGGDMAARVGAGILLAATSACAPPASHKLEASFSEAEHAPFMARGAARIEGQGFIRKANGHLVRCAGGNVYLLPMTPYFAEWIDAFRRGLAIADARQLEARHAGAVRKAQCDVEGHFSFADLPAGKWYLGARIIWQASGEVQGGTLVREIETPAKGVVKTLLADQNRIF
jgi:hypothetical protein